MKVVIAIDSSGWASEAFDWYVTHVHNPDNQVALYHFVEPPVIHGDDYGKIAEIYDAEIKGCNVIAKDLVDEFQRRMDANQISGKVTVQFSGRPGEAIIQAAKNEEAQLIVVGTRGLGTVRRTLLGSVSDFVVHHSSCPVAVCSHHHSPTSPKTPTSPMKSPFSNSLRSPLSRQMSCPLPKSPLTREFSCPLPTSFE